MTLHAEPLPTVHLDTPPHGLPSQSPVARRVGYTATAIVNVVLLVLLHVAPGWQQISFLTADTADVVGLVTLSLAIGLVVNLSWLLADPAWWRSAGELITSAVGLVALLQLLDVFPFDFTGWSFDPSWLVRVALILGVFGAAVSILVQAVTLVRLAVNAGR